MRQSGFTLIELSIVLVIIGLIVGGVLIGQDLISAAATRATISQLEKYNTAANTFYLKYGYIPGDIPDPYASRFGFPASGGIVGEGNGDGVLEGNCSYDPSSCVIAGEEGTFWVDLSIAKLVDGSFSTATPTNTPTTEITGTQVNLYLPPAKVGQGNYFYAWSLGTFFTLYPWYTATPYTTTYTNYFGISVITDLVAYQGWPNTSSPGLSVAQAYSIDKKIDDGLPTTGTVLALYVSGSDASWADGSTDAMYLPAPTQTAQAPGSCFDNGGVNNAVEHYSMEVNKGSNVVCGLSFKMQGPAR